MNPEECKLLMLAAENNDPTMLNDIPDNVFTDWFASSISDYRIITPVLREMFGISLTAVEKVPDNSPSVLDYLEHIGLKDAVLSMFHGQDYEYDGKRMDGKYQLRKAMLIAYNEIMNS